MACADRSSTRRGLRLACALVIPALAALTGCSPYESTKDLYQQVSAERFPPLPEQAVVPITDEIPFHRPFKVIGTISMSTTEGPQWMEGALEWNARRVGADAVVVTRREATEEPYTSYSGYSSGPRIGVGVGYGSGYRRGGYGYYGVSYDWWGPWYESGYVETRYRTRISVDAEFVALLDKETFGWIGLRPIEVGNSSELAIDALEPTGPAARAGLRTGDILVSVGGYDMNRGLRDFLQNGPSPRVGVPVEIVVRRGAETLRFVVTPEREPRW